MNIVKRETGVILLAAIFFLGNADAEEVGLDKIVVTPSRIEENVDEVAGRVDVISAKMIESSQGATAAKVLQGISSVDIKDYGGAGALETIQMRGSTASQVLVMMDGRPLQNGHMDSVDLTTVPLSNVERIEVMRGPASSLYGAAAMGGVVNFITKEPPKEGTKTTLRTSFGTFRTYAEQIIHGGRYKNFGYLLSGDYKTSEGHRDDSEYQQKSTDMKLTYDFSKDNNLVFHSGFFRDDYEAPGSAIYTDYNSNQRWLKRFMDLQWQSAIWEINRIKVHVYENNDRSENRNTAYDGQYATHVTKTRGLDAQISHAFSPAYRLLYGFNYVGNFDDSTKTRKHKYYLRAGYLQNTVELDKFMFVFGGRVDDYTHFGTEFSPQSRISYTPAESTKFWIAHGRSFRVPTFSDLFWPYAFWAYLDEGEEGNPNLRPEKGQSYEFGVEHAVMKNWRIELSYFRNDYKNLIKWARNSATKIWSPQNVNTASIQGVEFDTVMNIGMNWDATIGYTYQRPMDTIRHTYLTYQPVHKADFALTYHVPRGLTVTLKGDFVGQSSTDTTPLERYFLLGLDVNQKFGKAITAFISFDNLTNYNYQKQKDYPMPGFSLTSGLKLEF